MVAAFRASLVDFGYPTAEAACLADKIVTGVGLHELAAAGYDANDPAFASADPSPELTATLAAVSEYAHSECDVGPVTHEPVTVDDDGVLRDADGKTVGDLDGSG